jgi:hypothetical protein
MGVREDPIHIGVLDLMVLRLPGALIHHSANEMNLGSGSGDAEAKRQMRKSKAIAQARAKKLGMQPGFPDLMAWWRGNLFTLEVKVDGKGPTKDQARIGAQIIANGGRWGVVSSVWQADALLTEWIREARR